MGRGNYCPVGELTYQWYIDYDRYKEKDEDGEDEYEWFDDYMLNDDVGEIINRIEKRFSFFCRYEKHGVSRHAQYWNEYIWLKNKFFEIGVADNDWSYAFYIRENDELEPEELNLARKHFEEYKRGIQEILLDYYYEISLRNGAWMSSTLKKEVANAG